MADNAYQARQERQRLQRKRNLRLAGIWVLGPTLLAALMLAILPPDYEVKTEFTVQGATPAAPDLLGGLTGLAGKGQADNDARVLVDYLKSGAAVAFLRARYDFDGIYNEKDAPLEDATDLWRHKFKVDYDGGSQIVTATVKADTPTRSLKIAQGMLVASDNLVNSLASDVAAGGIRYADQQVRLAAVAYNQARQKIAQTQGTSTTLSLGAAAEEAIAVVGGLDGELAKSRVDLATMAQTYTENSPQMRAMRAQIGALEQQKATAIARASGAPGEQAAGGDVHVRSILLDYEFAQRAYYAATQAAQNARQQLESNRRYIVNFIPPRLPERSNYWARFVNVFVVLVVAALIYGIGSLSYSIIKDHVQ